MATATVSKTSILVKQVEGLLNPYEEFYLEQPISRFDYMLSLKTNVMIHRKYTKKDLFFRHSVYQATSMTDLPNMDWLKSWLKIAREAAQKLLDKGEYTTEELISGEYQTIKRKYNQWIYLDRRDGMLFGKVHNVAGAVQTRPSKEKKNVK